MGSKRKPFPTKPPLLEIQREGIKIKSRPGKNVRRSHGRELVSRQRPCFVRSKTIGDKLGSLEFQFNRKGRKTVLKKAVPLLNNLHPLNPNGACQSIATFRVEIQRLRLALLP